MAVVISGGVAVATYKPQAVQATALRLTDTETKTYAELWRTQPQIRTVVSFLARNVAQLGLHLYRRVSDLDRERVTDHPLARLLQHPNPYTTQYRFSESLVSDLAIYDNAYFMKVRLKDQPLALVRIDPRQVQVVGDDPFVAEAYRIGRQEFKRESIVHFRGYSPLDARVGMSPMESLRELLAEDRQATLYREQLWRNGARMSGYIERPLEAPQWTREGKERFRAAWQAQYTAGGSGPGGTPILEDGMKYVPAATSPKDAQWLESRKLTREEVAAAYHIPLTLVGILDHATYSNISEQHKMLYQDTLGPTLQMIQQELKLQLFPDFPGTEDMYCEYNIAEKLRGSFEEQAQQLQSAVGGPWMTRNEARARMNLPQLDDADNLINPLNLGAVTSEDAKLPLLTRDQAATFGELVRAGVDPADAARLIGIPSVQVVDALPTTLRTPEEIEAGIRYTRPQRVDS